MKRIAISGGKKLNGEVQCQGSKNAALPILAATVLNPNECELTNCPDLKDVSSALKIIGHLGGKTAYSDYTATVNAANIHKFEIGEELMASMRSSVLFLGSMLSRFKQAVISYPGGCSIGLRPIDLHIKAFRQMGVSVEEIGGKIYCKAEKIIPTRINMIFPSVGATENIMIAACLAKGTTTITNAAREP